MFTRISDCLYVCLQIRYFHQSAMGSWNTEVAHFFPHFYPANQIREIKEGKQAKRQTGDRQRKQMRRRQWRLKRGGRGRGESASLIYLTSLMRVRVSPAYYSMMCLSSLHCRISSVTLMKLSSEPGTKPQSKLVSSPLWSLVAPHIWNGWRRPSCSN